MSDTFQYIHMAYTGIVSIIGAYFGYRAVVKKKDSSEVCEKDFRVLKNEVENLKIETAVLKEQHLSDNKLLDKIDSKLDDLRERL